MNFITFVFQDWKNNKGNSKGKIATFCFRLANYASQKSFLKVLLLPYLIIYKILFEWLIGFEVPYDVKIGPGFVVFHLQAIVINKNSVIGKNFTLRHSTTIGNKSAHGNSPRIGDNVDLGANVCIVGDIEIGNNVIIGIGSVVINNIPSNSVAVGNPARIIKQI